MQSLSCVAVLWGASERHAWPMRSVVIVIEPGNVVNACAFNSADDSDSIPVRLQASVRAASQ